MTREEIEAFFAAHVRAYNSHDIDAIASHYTSDCVVESPMAGTLQGREAMVRATRLLFAAIPDLRVEPDELLIVGDRVVQTGVSSGTDTGGFAGLPPTGRPYRVGVVFLFRLKDGLIVHERRVYDFSGFLLQLAGELGPAMESVRLYREILERAELEHEVRVAADIQRALLPELRRCSETFDVAAASLPCRAIGGDFIDYFDLPHGAFGFVLGDAAGKGPPAALLAAQLQGILAAHSYSGQSPAETMRLANAALLRRGLPSRFATAFYGQLLPDGCLVYCNAGHNPPFLVGAHRTERLVTGGVILGAFAPAAFEQGVIRLESDDLLVLFSDGVPDAVDPSGAEFGDERIAAFARSHRSVSPPAFVDQLLQTIQAFMQGEPQKDDLTILVLRQHAVPSPIGR